MKLSCQFIADRYLPDKARAQIPFQGKRMRSEAIDVMDEAGSKV